MDFTDPHARFARAPDQVACELDGEIAILDLQSQLYFGMANVAALVWQKLERPVPIEALIEAVTAEFDVSEEECRSDILQFMRELRGAGLVTRQD